MRRFYYSNETGVFLKSNPEHVLGELVESFGTQKILASQRNAWQAQIQILQSHLQNLEDVLDGEARILFEYGIPRMGKRVDNVLLARIIVFLLEFKCGAKEYRTADAQQVLDYALDLEAFHLQSRSVLLIPVLVATDAPSCDYTLPAITSDNKSGVLEPYFANQSNLFEILQALCKAFPNQDQINYRCWECSKYFPSPTIVEAAQALYQGHNVADITRSDAGTENLEKTSQKIDEIIAHSKKHNRKSICFVTGVPGAGKTLIGLETAIKYSDPNKDDHATFLSGNYPLVSVLQEALARDKVAQEKSLGQKGVKKDALRKTAAFIQMIHNYHDSFVDNANKPPEHVVIFDEAQRSWTREQLTKFMIERKGVDSLQVSEPEFLIRTIDRHDDWGVVICLVGGGQEINTGEAGLPEWFDALRRSFSHWDVYVTPHLNDSEYLGKTNWDQMLEGLNVHESPELHLSSSVRSFRSPKLAAFVKALLDVDVEEARSCFSQMKDYPIFITRDIEKARSWVREKGRGSQRYGLLASSSADRLRADGIFIENKLRAPNWFLNPKGDVRSSYQLELVATEFEIQGLELDYSIVAWDADLRFVEGNWEYYRFRQSSWGNVNKEERRVYLKNAYRVLLTRARQGMIIYLPKGESDDDSRLPELYDGTYEYLRSLGIPEIP